MVPRIRHREDTVRRRDPRRNVKSRRARFPFGLAFRVASLTGKIALADQKIGRRVIRHRRPMPDQQPVMPGVAHEQWPIRTAKAGAAWAKHCVWAWHDRPRNAVRAQYYP